MNEPIELAIESPDGIIDCRIETQKDETGVFYAATILYPNVVDGFSRSEIYCHNMREDGKGGDYHFDNSDEVHPKILRLESQLSAAIKVANAGNKN